MTLTRLPLKGSQSDLAIFFLYIVIIVPSSKLIDLVLLRYARGLSLQAPGTST